MLYTNENETEGVNLFMKNITCHELKITVPNEIKKKIIKYL